MKRIENLRSLSTDKLQNRVNEIEVDLHRSRIFFKKNQGKVMQGVQTKNNGVNTKFMKNLRKEKARILTILSERRKNNKW